MVGVMAISGVLVVLFHVEWCITQLSFSSIIICNIVVIAYNQSPSILMYWSDIYPFFKRTNIHIYISVSPALVESQSVLNKKLAETQKDLGISKNNYEQTKEGKKLLGQQCVRLKQSVSDLEKGLMESRASLSALQVSLSRGLSRGLGLV